MKKQRTEQLDALLVKLQLLETQHKQTLTPQVGTDLDTTRRQITDLLHYKAKAAIQICRRNVYESGNKCGRMLAQAIRTQNMASYIPHIVTWEGKKVSVPQQISQEFKSFYSNLYNLPSTHADINPDLTSTYLEASCMPTLTTDMRETLEEPITLSEIQAALKSAKPGKAPGPGWPYHRVL